MDQITIVPTDQVVVLNGSAAFRVDMTSVDPEIHAIQFNTEYNIGWIEFKTDPETGETRPPEQITNIDPWQDQVSEAQEIIFCRDNPKTFYSTVAPVGSPIVVTEKGWPQPENSTDQVPPERPSPNTSLYWDGTKFVWSAFPIDLSLPEAQESMKEVVNSEAYNLLQPSDWYVVRKSEIGTEIPQTWSDWRESIRTTASEKRNAIDETPSLMELSKYTQSEIYLVWPSSPKN